MKQSYSSDIAQSLYNLIEHKLLEAGAYHNIATGQSDPKGIDVSAFVPVIDPEKTETPGVVWQSFHRNFVYESGVVNQPPPIVISGVYIDGVFTPKSATMVVDHENGRVLFSTPQSTSAQIRANFSSKEYSFLRSRAFRGIKDETKFVPNSPIYTSGVPASPEITYMPAIFVSMESSEERGFQLGGTHETNPTIKFRIISDDADQIDDIADTMESLSTTSFPIVSASEGPKFNSHGDILENYSFYDWVKKSSNYAHIKSVKYNRFDATSEENQPRLYVGVVNFEISAIR